MKNLMTNFKTPLAIAITAASLALGACSTTKAPDGAANVRAKLTQLQTDPQLASRAQLELKTAEEAVRAAEHPTDDKEEAKHLVFLADRKIDIASAQAHKRLAEDQRKDIGDESTKARLESRDKQIDAARADADAAKQQAEELQRQIAELNAKQTERGLVVTLGDVLFDTGKADLKATAAANLGKLSAFLIKNPDRTVIIEVHTDNVGSDDYNMGLSQRRADSVRSLLVSQGVEGTRLTASGKGESTPVAGNDTASGRQQNRRVEVIISNKAGM